MQLRGKAVADAVALAGGDLKIVSRGRQVTHDLRWLIREPRRPQTPADEDHADRLWLVVGEGEERLCCVAVDEFDAEDLGGWELCRDFDC